MSDLVLSNSALAISEFLTSPIRVLIILVVAALVVGWVLWWQLSRKPRQKSAGWPTDAPSGAGLGGSSAFGGAAKRDEYNMEDGSTDAGPGEGPHLTATERIGSRSPGVAGAPTARAMSPNPPVATPIAARPVHSPSGTGGGQVQKPGATMHGEDDLAKTLRAVLADEMAKLESRLPCAGGHVDRERLLVVERDLDQQKNTLNRQREAFERLNGTVSKHGDELRGMVESMRRRGEEIEELRAKIRAMEQRVAYLEEFKQSSMSRLVAGLQQSADAARKQVSDALSLGEVFSDDCRSLALAVEHILAAGLDPALQDVVQVARRIRERIDGQPETAGLREFLAARKRLRDIGKRLDSIAEGVESLSPDQVPPVEREIKELRTDIDRECTRLSPDNVRNGVQPEVVHEMRMELIRAIDRPYTMEVKRAAGSRVVEEIEKILNCLGLRLIRVEPGKTRLDKDNHKVASAERSPGLAPGTIVDVVQMGYIDKKTGNRTPAEVIISDGSGTA